MKQASKVLAKHKIRDFEAEIDRFDRLFKERDFEDLSADWLDREKNRLIELKCDVKILKEFIDEK